MKMKMEISKAKVLEVLQSMELADKVKNLQLFGSEIELDLSVSLPALAQRKKFEDALLQAFQDEFGKEVDLKLQFGELPKAKEEPAAIKGKPIPGVKNIIAISSGKGGVGKSTVTSNLAISLQQMGFKVGVLDTDIYGPSIPIMFDVIDEKPKQIHIDGKPRIQPVEAHGIKLLSIGFFTEGDQAVVWRGPMASKALNQMIRDAHWGELDFLLLDLPPGTGDIHLSIVQQVPVTGAVIVSTPQKVAMADVKRGVNMFGLSSINVPVLGIVENMAYFTPAELPDNKYYLFGKNGAREMAESLNVPFLGEIPIVQSIREAGDSGNPIVLAEGSPMQLIFKEIAQKTIDSLVKRNKDLPPTEVVRITTMAGCSTK